VGPSVICEDGLDEAVEKGLVPLDIRGIVSREMSRPLGTVLHWSAS
jgi:hypothetical protein